MKNIKTYITFGTILIALVIGIAYKNGQKNSYKVVYGFEASSPTKNITFEVEKIKVHLTGEVNNPGIYTIPKGTKLYELIKLSGGQTNLANTNRVNLVKILKDGQRIKIPSLYETTAAETCIIGPPININTANKDELTKIKGVGPKTAQAIIEYRNKIVSFKSIKELLNVKGIGPKTLESIRHQIKI
jgi:competence protein ComEA